jgi:type II restriction/modification system DNA methylase subunit YeeA
VVVKGVKINHEYITYLNQRNSIISEQKAIWQNYMSLTANDSLVNIEQEQKLARQDSVLSDSLERITIEAINRGTPASRIIYDRYVSSLRHNYLRKINIH